MTSPTSFPLKKYLQLPSIKIHYWEWGLGPPLILLPSMLVLARTYTPIARELSRNFKVFVIELPGSGLSERLTSPWIFEQYAEIIGPLIQNLGQEKVHLIGHSNSGPVATIASVLFPEKIASLILTDSVGGDRSFSLTRVILSRAFDSLLEPRLTLFAGPHLSVNLLLHMRNLIHQIWLAGRYDLTEWARKVKVPTLLAWGGRDFTMPLRCAYYLQSLIPQSKIHLYQKGSHDWINVYPQDFSIALRNFLGFPQIKN